ncbi:TELO2 interacting protein 1 [Musa troglodytarum]|uniref:TELO2 interacting protein 1 n=1 Tax=Musa troglodytarum TaxID=320322 RepID=A0A9E7HIE2_9LILI|nr:TELO2 interacting protein 1 [Musa troglodytarum]
MVSEKGRSCDKGEGEEGGEGRGGWCREEGSYDGGREGREEEEERIGEGGLPLRRRKRRRKREIPGAETPLLPLFANGGEKERYSRSPTKRRGGRKGERESPIGRESEEKKVGSDGGFGNGGAPLGGHAISDSAAEGMLMCLEELLKKCHLGSVNRMVVVLKKITAGAMLSHSEASEEFRVGIIRCFRTMLLNLQPCSVNSCSCKQRVIMPTSKSIDGAFVLHNTISRNHVESLDCLLAFLQSQNASAAVGHWLSLLLQFSQALKAQPNACTD